jgi:hypothetical protein
MLEKGLISRHRICVAVCEQLDLLCSPSISVAFVCLLNTFLYLSA